ncbi:uncharacterized mitochondrial protein-like protein [Tanacetum coccineum]
MRPFGCPVTILNTLDPLGKFDEKADEGFFVRYSINSKAFRVFNTRNRKVEENLHINIFENKPNVTGSEPDWLFDIDLLTNSMNYEPVTAGNQTNKNAGNKDNGTQQYILLPLLFNSPQSSKDAVANDAGKKTNKEPANEGERNGQEKVGGASNKVDDQNVHDFRDELDSLLVQQKEGYANNTNKDSTVSPSVSAAGGAYDDEDVGAEANLNNLETTINLHQDKVYKVEKALYGLHQALRAWYKTLSTYLFENRFRRGTIDKTLYIKKERDDAQEIPDEFYGEAYFLLRIATSTLIETNKALLKDEEAEDVDVHLYRSMIGSLMYLTASRPDIMFAICACARFQVTPKVSHLDAVKRIFRYLKGQSKFGLWYPRDSPYDLEAFSDSDYARASLDRKSTIGGVMDPKSNA